MTIDIVIGIILCFFLVSGFFLGFFVEFISIFGLIGVFFCSSYLTPIAVEALKAYYSDANKTKGYIVIFFALYLLLMFVMKYINRLLMAQEKSAFNRIGGGILSLLKGIVISAIIITVLLIASKYNKSIKKQIEESKAIKLYDEFETYIAPYIPEELKGRVEAIKEKEAVETYIKKIL
ncbi:MAG: CvpA family protein [Fusobacteriaceae bacterium]